MLPYAQSGPKIKMVFSGVNATQTNCNMASAVARFCPSSTRLAEFSILMIIVPDIFQDQDCVKIVVFPNRYSIFSRVGRPIWGHWGIPWRDGQWLGARELWEVGDPRLDPGNWDHSDFWLGFFWLSQELEIANVWRRVLIKKCHRRKCKRFIELIWSQLCQIIDW